MGYTSRQAVVIGVHWSLFGVATLVLAARFLVRTQLRPGSLGWDDWSMLLAYALAIPAGAVEVILIQLGIGRHMDTIDPINYSTISKLSIVNTSLNFIGAMMVKVSVCLFLLRIVYHANRTVKWLVVINLAILVPFTCATVILDLVLCIPLQGYWNDPSRPKCMTSTTINILHKVASGVGVGTDFMTAAIPLIIVYRLQMSLKQKCATCIVLALGFFVAGGSIGKTIIIQWTSKDYSWDNLHAGLWGNIEFVGGIITGCLATLRPMLQYIHSSCFAPVTAGHDHTLGPLRSSAMYSRSRGKGRANSKDELLRDMLDSGMQIRKTNEVEVAPEEGQEEHRSETRPYLEGRDGVDVVHLPRGTKQPT